MSESPVRIFAGFCILVVVWIGVYWWWEPADGRISFADVDPAPNVAPEVAPARGSPEGSRVVPPSFVEYTVKAEDKSLADISRKFYGTPEQWRAIARANPLMDPARMKVGRVIRIPADPRNIQGRVIKPGPPTGPNAGPPAAVEYTVLDGDSLSTISQQFYGTTKQAKFIFEANRERLKLKSMDSIRAGQVLVIPPLAGAGGG